MNIKGMSVGPIGTNCYIVYKGKEALIIDPGAEADNITDYLQQNNLQVKAILLTHAHFDHIGALEVIRVQTGAKVYIHENEMSWLSDPEKNGSRKLRGNEITARAAEFTLVPGNMQLGSFNFTILHTPGHSPGSVSFIFEEDQFIVSGDVLFYQGIGRTDLYGGSMEDLEVSIRNKLYTLDDTYTIYPGHGPETTIGMEKQRNPFVRA